MPIEHKVLKQISSSSHLTEQQKKRHMEHCSLVRRNSRSLAEQCIERQRNGFKRWAVTAQWDTPYLTFDRNYVIEELKIVMEMFEKGLLLRGKRPVYFSPSSQSVLADSEIEYRDVECTAVYAALPLTSYPGCWSQFLPESCCGAVSVVIWTTQPWTLLANAAVAYNPNLCYKLVLDATNSQCFLLEASIVEKVAQILQTELEELATLAEDDFKHLSYQLSFDSIAPPG